MAQNHRENERYKKVLKVRRFAVRAPFFLGLTLLETTNRRRFSFQCERVGFLATVGCSRSPAFIERGSCHVAPRLPGADAPGYLADLSAPWFAERTSRISCRSSVPA